MSKIRIIKRSKMNYAPANWNANEIATVISVGAGEVVTGAFVNIRAVYDGTTVKAEMGDGDNKDGYIADAESACDTATGVKVGAGAYLASAPGARLYTAADTVDINYTLGATDSSNIGRSDWWIWVARAHPN